jgi:hypothetical protein
VDLPLSANELVAALYESNGYVRDLVDDEWVRSLVTVVIVSDGLPAIQDRAMSLDEVKDREWLAFCRRRIAEVYGVDTTPVPPAGERCRFCGRHCTGEVQAKHDRVTRELAARATGASRAPVVA